MSKFVNFDIPVELYIKVYFILWVEKNVRGTSQPTTVFLDMVLSWKFEAHKLHLEQS